MGVNMKKAIFITLEGGEGVGKSTQLNFLGEWFKAHNMPFITTHEPGGTPLGEEVRKILKHADYKITPRSELFLLNACRAELVDDVIIPALSSGVSVISDRYLDTCIAYQYYARGIEYDKVKDMTEYAISNNYPTITFWLDLPPIDAFRRKMGADENDRFEQSGLDFHNKVYNGYKEMHAQNPDRIKRIDASKSAEEVKEEIEKYLDELFLDN